MSSKEKNSGPGADFFESPVKTGWLTKLGGTGLKANWRRRYIVLDHHYLFYYKTDKDRSPAGIICLPEYDIVAKADYKECKKPNSFVITSSDNIAATPSDHKRAYYMYTETEGECLEWIEVIKSQMTANIDPNQKHYFTLNELHSTVKNGYQDVIVGNFDDLSLMDGPKLEHVTANRPKKPGTRLPSRGAKDLVPFDEDDFSSYSFSPASDFEETKKIAIKPIQKRPSPNIKPLKPPGDTLSITERPLITKPKPSVKPNFLKHASQSDTISPPVQKDMQPFRSLDVTIPESDSMEFAPKPTPRRKAPTIPEVTRESSAVLSPPILPTHPRTRSQSPSPDRSSPPKETLSPVDHTLTRRPAPSLPSQTPRTPEETLSPTPSAAIRLSPSLPESVLTARHTPSPPIPVTRSQSSSPIPGTPHVTSPPDEYFTRLSPNQRDSSSSDSSSSGENVYQVPRIDPIYQIPSSYPVLFSQTPETERETDTSKTLQRLHSVGMSVTPSPKASVDGPNYSNLVTEYFCSSPNPNTPPISPIPSHQLLARNYRSLSLPKEYRINSNQTENKRRSSTCSANSSRPNSAIMDTENTERILTQIRELEEQLFSLTSGSPRKQSLSPSMTRPNSSSNILLTDAQKLIDNMRSVMFEAIGFHKQAAEDLQTAKTEKRIAEKERMDAELNAENLTQLIAKFHQNTANNN